MNGSTALHAAYLCRDPFLVDVLEAGGATPFLDGLGRYPAELTTIIPSASEITTREDQKVPPSAVGNVSRL